LHKVKLKGVVYLEVENSKKIEEQNKQSKGNSKRSEDYTKRSKENIIEKTCRELGVNQKQLAGLMSVSENSLSWWKNNKKPMPKWAYRLIELLIKEKEHTEITKLLKKYK
jgi:DNA-binding transcriptional regulator YiaG